MMSKSSFRAYDIRGIFGKDIDETDAEKIGYVLAKMVENDIVIAMDMRASSKLMREKAVIGITNAGKSVEDIGLVPMGVAMFYAWKNKKTLAYITASHLPKEWAGIKFFHATGEGFSEKDNTQIKDNFFSLEAMENGTGTVEEKNSEDAINSYVAFLTTELKAEKKLSVALDFGNGMGSVIGKKLFEKAGFEVTTIYDNLSDTPERNAEPNIDPLTKLTETAKDIGIAYDGDADRMILVDEKGNILTCEQTSYLILSQITKEKEGDVVANIECSMSLDDTVSEFKRNLYRQPVGHTFLVENALSKKACFGAESSGHYIIPSIVPFDDAIAVSLYAAVALSHLDKPLSEIMKNVQVYPFDRINVDCPDEKKFQIIDKLKEEFSGYNIDTTDGLRIELGDAWVLIRASNTSPVIRMTIEAKSEKSFESVKAQFVEVLEDVVKN
jgi:phosphomannomutase